MAVLQNSSGWPVCGRIRGRCLSAVPRWVWTIWMLVMFWLAFSTNKRGESSQTNSLILSALRFKTPKISSAWGADYKNTRSLLYTNHGNIATCQHMDFWVFVVTMMRILRRFQTFQDDSEVLTECKPPCSHSTLDSEATSSPLAPIDAVVQRHLHSFTNWHIKGSNYASTPTAEHPECG